MLVKDLIKFLTENYEPTANVMWQTFEKEDVEPALSDGIWDLACELSGNNPISQDVFGCQDYINQAEQMLGVADHV